MNQIKLINIPAPVSEEKVVELLFQLQSLYQEGVSIAESYNDMVAAVKNGVYHNQHMAQCVLDGARGARDAEIAHIRDRIFIQLRDFFEPLECTHSK